MEKIVIAAANGFLGQKLIGYFSGRFEIVGLVRKPMEDTDGVRYVLWDGKTLGSWQLEIEGALAVINLAGRSVDCRYTEENKRQILDSRLQSTRVLGEAIDLCDHPPSIWMNSASATIYAYSLDHPNSESDHTFGSGFSVDVCQQWEKIFFEHTYSNVRQIALRITIVFGREGGAYPVMRKLTRWGLGGKQGPGNQMVSWIHIDDFCRAVDFLLTAEDVSGPVNMAAPNPLSNKEFMRLMRESLGRSFGLPSPEFLLKIGARIIQTETELILKSRFVVPERLLNSGFSFEYPTMEEALRDLSNSGNETP